MPKTKSITRGLRNREVGHMSLDNYQKLIELLKSLHKPIMKCNNYLGSDNHSVPNKKLSGTRRKRSSNNNNLLVPN